MKDKHRTEFVDRQVMTDPDFELYYYADDALASVRSHQHSGYELLFFLEGNAVSRIGTQSYSLRPQDVLIIPCGLFHSMSIQKGEQYRRFTLWISTDYLGKLRAFSENFFWLPEYAASHETYCFHLNKVDFQEIQTSLLRILENRRKTGFGDQTYTSLCCAELLLGLTRMIYAQIYPDPRTEGQPLFDSLLRYIQTHLEQDLSLDSLASRFFVSKFYISHLFKERMGLSVHQYVIKKRLDQVRGAIVQGRDISRAASEMGFHNYSSFYRAFVREFGISPKEYARQYALAPFDPRK